MSVVRLSLLCCFTVWLAGCAHPQATSKPNVGCANPQPQLTLAHRDAEAARTLEAQLKALDPSVNCKEALRLAECAVAGSRQLAREYGAVRPAFFHNMLVNAGWKKRGLCHHWADDLYARFRALDLRTLEPHLAIARPGTRREHNSVVITAVRQLFVQGVVLDAWRHSGRLYFGDLKEDRYAWQLVHPRDDEPGTPDQRTGAVSVSSPASSSPPPESALHP